MSPDDFEIRWYERAGPEWESHARVWDGDGAEWDYVERTAREIDGTEPATALTVEWDGDLPQPDRVTVTWRAGRCRRSLVADSKTKAGAWAVVEREWTGAKWRDVGQVDVRDLGVRAGVVGTGQTYAGP